MGTVFLQGFPGGSAGKESTCSAGDQGLIPGWEDSLEKGMATHSSILLGGDKMFQNQIVVEADQL